MSLTAAQLVISVATDVSSAQQGIGTLAGLLTSVGGISTKTAAEFGLVGVAAAGLAAGFDASLSEASKFQTMLQQLQANSQLTASDMPQVASSIKSLADQSGAGFQSLADGYRHASSEGFNFSDSQKIVQAAMQSAVATGADLGQTADILATTLHVFGLSGDDAARAMETLHVAAQAGDLTMQQFVSFGRPAISMAGALHDSLADVSAAFSALSENGQKANQANTGLQSIMQQIINPTKSASAAIAELARTSGVDLVSDFTLTGLQTKGLVGILSDLSTAMGGNEQEALKLFSGWRGGRNVLELLNNGGADLNRILGLTTATMAGQATPVAAGYQAALATAGRQVDILRANLATAGVTLGTIFLPVATDALKTLNDLAGFAGKTFTTTQKLIVEFSQTNLGGDIKSFLDGSWLNNVTPPSEQSKKKFSDLFFGLDPAAIATNLKNSIGSAVDDAARSPDQQNQKKLSDLLFPPAVVGSDNPVRQWLDTALDPAGLKDLETKETAQINEISQNLAAALRSGMSYALATGLSANVGPEPSSSIQDALNASLDRSAQALAQGTEGQQLAGAVKGQVAKAGSGATDGADAAAQQIASGVSTIATALENGMKALADLRGFNVPDVQAQVDRLTQGLKQIFDSFGDAFSGVDATSATDAGKVAQATDQMVTAVKNIADLYKTIPDVTVSDPAGKIQLLVAEAGRLRDAWSAAVGTAADPTTEAAAGSVAESVSKEATMLKDVADVFKQMAGVDISDPSGKISALAQYAAQIKDQTTSFLNLSADTATLASGSADAVSKEATMLKDTADVFKEMAGVDISDPSGKLSALVGYAAQIKSETTGFLNLSADTATMAGATADAVGKEATMLKDTVALFKEMAGVDVADPSGKVAALSGYASQIKDLTTSFLTFSKDSADAIGASADAVGREATMLKDTVALFKDMADVVIADPSGKVGLLSQYAQTIQAETTSFLTWSKDAADNISASADAVGREATMLKDVTDLFKEMADVVVADPTGKVGQLAGYAAQIQADTTPLLGWTKDTADNLGASADAISKEATLLRDVATLFSTMASVVVADPTGKIALLATYGEQIDALLSGYLLGQTRSAQLSAAATAVADEVKVVSDVAALFNTLATLAPSDPGPALQRLAAAAESVNDLLGSYLQGAALGAGEADTAAKAISDEVTALRSVAELVGSLATLDLGGAGPDRVAALTGTLQSLAQGWDAAVAAMDPQALVRAQEFSAGISQSLAALKAGLDLLAGLSTLAAPGTAQVAAFVASLTQMLALWDAQAASWPDDFLARAQAFGTRVSGAVAPLQSGLTVLKDLGAVAEPAPVQVATFALSLARVLGDWDGQVAAFPDDFLERSQQFSARMSGALTPLSAGLGVLKDLAGLAEPTEAQVQGFSRSLALVLTDWDTTAASFPDDLLTRAQSFAGRMSGVLTPLTSGLTLLKDLEAEATPGPVAVAQFATDLQNLLLLWDQQVASFPQGFLLRSQTFSDRITAALGPLRAGVDALTSLDTFRPPDPARIAAFVQGLAATLNQFDQLFANSILLGGAGGGSRINTNLLGTASPEFQQIQAALTSISDAVKALSDLAGFSGVSDQDVQTAVSSIVRTVNAYDQAIAQVNTILAGSQSSQGSALNAGALASAQRSATEIQTLMTSISAGLTAMNSLATFAPPSQNQIQALITGMKTAVDAYLKGLGDIRVSLEQQDATTGIQAIVDTISKSFDLFQKLSTSFGFSRQWLDALVDETKQAVQEYETRMAGVAVSLATQDQATGVGKVIDVLTKSIQAFSDLEKLKSIPAQELASIADATVNAARQFVADVANIPDDQLASAAHKADLIKSIMDALQAALGAAGTGSARGTGSRSSGGGSGGGGSSNQARPGIDTSGPQTNLRLAMPAPTPEGLGGTGAGGASRSSTSSAPSQGQLVVQNTVNIGNQQVAQVTSTHLFDEIAATNVAV